MGRNSSGTYTLPSPGVPFQSGATISSSQVNATLSDLAAEVTSSLDRAGRGGALAPIRGVDGTAAAPAVAFTAEINSGLYRAGANDIRLAIGGVDFFTPTSLTFPSGIAPVVAATAANAELVLRGNRDATNGNDDVAIISNVNRTAGYLLGVWNNAGNAKKFQVDYQGLVSLAFQAAPIQPATMVTAITPNAGWTAGGGLGYWKDAGGVVHLKGSVQYATGATSPAFTLPAGFRPASTRSWAMYSVSQGLAAAFHINADGTSTGDNAVNGFSYALDAVTFLAEQ